MHNTFFIAGTDTDVGKTHVTAGLLAAARHLGLSTLGIKPLASGCSPTAEGLRNSDALALIAQSSLKLAYSKVNPFAFEPAVAPHIAAENIGIELSAKSLLQACATALAQPVDLCLIEGAGGWYVPLSAAETLADFARRLQVPVILVVGMRLGCISHALLSYEAIQRDGLQCAGWIANTIDPDMPYLEENIHTLKQHIPAPCLAQLSWHDELSADRLVQECLPALKYLNMSQR